MGGAHGSLITKMKLVAVIIKSFHSVHNLIHFCSRVKLNQVLKQKLHNFYRMQWWHISCHIDSATQFETTKSISRRRRTHPKCVTIHLYELPFSSFIQGYKYVQQDELPSRCGVWILRKFCNEDLTNFTMLIQ